MCACTVWIEMQVFCTNHYLTEAGGKVWGCGTVGGSYGGELCVGSCGGCGPGMWGELCGGAV